MRQYVPLVMGLSFFMETLDLKMITTVIPTISKSLNVSPIHLKYVLIAYFIGLMSFVSIGAWVSKRVGATRTFFIGICFFMVGTLTAGVTINIYTLVFSRFIQGVGGALMGPIARSMMLKHSPSSMHATLMSYYTIPAAVGSMLGPVVAGAVVTFVSWRCVFFINLPISILVLWMAKKTFPKDEGKQIHSFDFKGFILLNAFILLLLILLESLDVFWMHTMYMIALIIAVIGVLAMFLYYLTTMKNSLFDVNLIYDQSFLPLCCAGLIFSIAISASTFLMPLFFQLGLGFSPLSSGTLLMAFGVGVVLGRVINPEGIDALGVKFWSLLNAFLGVLSFWGLSQMNQQAYGPLVLLLYVQGQVAAILITNIAIMMFKNTPSHLITQASGVYELQKRLGAVIGVSLAGFVFGVVQSMLDVRTFSSITVYHQLFKGVAILVVCAMLFLLSYRQSDRTSLNELK